MKAKKLPFTPEDLTRAEGHKEIIEEAMKLEQVAREKYYSQAK